MPRLLLSLASFFFLTLLLVFALLPRLPPVVAALLVVVGPAVGSILGTLHRLPVRTRHVRSLWHVLVAHDHVKLHFFTVGNRPQELLGVVLDDGGLVDKDVTVLVVTVNEAVAVANH